MSEIILPTYDQLMQPTIDALHTLKDEASIQEIYDHVVAITNLSPDILSIIHGSDGRMTEVEYRLHWTRTYLKRAGLIDNPVRGRWCLTSAGQITQQIDPSEIVASVKQQLRDEQRMAAGRSVDSDDQDQVVDPVEATETSLSKEIDEVGYLKSPTPLLPSYVSAQHFLKILNNTSYADYRHMYNSIWDQRGNPQEQTDWADPDLWIVERLEGTDQVLALKIWNESDKRLNPRYLRGCWYLVTRHNLLRRDMQGNMHVTDLGQQFLAELDGQVVVAIDSNEGIPAILRLVAEKGPGKRSEFLSGYSDYCRISTTIKSENVIKGSLYDRLTNLIDRGFVLRRGQSYEITDAGLAYLDMHTDWVPGPAPVRESQSTIRKMAKSLSEEARMHLQEYLLEMDPFKFEELIKLLLEEMGYDNVETTSPTNDKGVDVVGDIELGISSVREVIQVKRYRGGINRTILDQLRGSLHRFSAVRGTIITTGRFSKGAQEAAFERGAAPITLIDGEKLLDLLMQNQIGVTKKSVDYFEFAQDKLSQFE